MAIKSYFFDAVANPDGTWDRTYSAEDFSNYLNLLVGSGVFPNPSTNLQVTASTGLDLIVKSGSGWINGRKVESTTDVVLTLDNADVLNDRIDRVIFYIDYEARAFGIGIKKGTAAANPEPPALTRTSSLIEYCLADVAVAANTQTITDANITDMRADSTVCGWVAGLIQQVDTSTLFNQWQTAYENYYAQINQELNEFMQTLTETLRVNTYLTSFRVDTTLDSSSTQTVESGKYIYPIIFNPTNYVRDITDVIKVYINGLLGIPNVDYNVNSSSSTLIVSIIFAEELTAEQDITIEVLKTEIGIAAMVDSNGNQIVTSNDDNIIMGG